ncbi:TPA: hypothetical protein EYP45_03545 [Candidatus Peregrinibacteria bacterium]|nr:hypothetical protein [Candidatus Peregrinibacteria bacterium]
MRKLAENTFNDFENRQEIWELYGELLDFYSDACFSAKQVAYETGYSKKIVNKILHRLIQFKAVSLVGLDAWSVKIYRLNEEFTS